MRVRGFGLLPTWPTRGTYHRIPDMVTLLLSIPIDHSLISPELRVADVRTGTDTGSDHRPLVIDLWIGADGLLKREIFPRTEYRNQETEYGS